MKLLLSLLILFIFTNLQALDIKKNLAELEVKSPLLNEIIKITPIEKHHFNLEAPQNCSESKDSSSIDPSASAITCQFHKPGKHTITVSVCDDQKKYCKQEYIEVNVSKTNSGNKKIAHSPIATTKESQNKLKKVILPGFHIATPSEAKTLLKPEHKGVIVLASAEWCPPCNKNKEFLFPQEGFQSAAGSFLKIYVDGDSTSMDKWKTIIDFKYYPSFVFLNRDFKQVDIRISDTDSYNFSQWVKGFDNISKTPIKEVLKRYESRKSGSIWQKIKDFIGKTNHEQDQERLTHWYKNNYDFLSLYDVVDKTKYPKLFQMAQVEYLNDKLGKTTDETQKKILQSHLKSSVSTILLLNPHEYITAPDLLAEHCNMSAEDSFIPKHECESLFISYINSLVVTRDKDKDKLTDVDIATRAATYHATKLRFTKLKNTPENKLVALRQNCFDAFELLKGHTPLKNKSRYTKTRQVLCLSEKSLESSGLAILIDLINDYPHEEIYYRKKAKILMDTKKYSQALESINKAIKYSYGNLVYYNSISKAKILKSLGKLDDGKSILNNLVSSISLKKDSKREQRMLTRLRKTIKDLSK